MLTDDFGGLFRADNHGWFFGWTNGLVFQACRTQTQPGFVAAFALYSLTCRCLLLTPKIDPC